MVVLCDVQHRRLSFRSVTRLSLVCSWSPPSTHQGSRVRQGYGVREAFWEPCSVARRAASATISDFRIRDLGWCNALSLHCVCAVFRCRAGVPICFTSLFRVCVWQAIRGEGVVGPHSAPSRDRKSTRLNSSHLVISYAVFCLKKKRAGPSLEER